MEMELLYSLAGETEVRSWRVILLMCAATASAAEWERDGRSLFGACEFRQAARAFEKAVAEQPDRAELHFLLGKSYARLAEISSSLSAPKSARKARRSLEQAVRLDPRNDEYLQELFDFYVDSPEWRIGGGLQRAAALLERISDWKTGSWQQRLGASRNEHSGFGWWLRRTVLVTSGAIGYVVPQP